MRKDIIIIICLMLCLGVAIGCLPNNVGYLNDNLPITSPTIPMLEIEPKATVTGTSFPTPTAISTPTTIPLDTPVPTQIPTGELYIFSEPEGAVAGIASENLSAHAPVSWTMLPGTYTVTLTLEGYQEWITPINVTAGSQVTLAVTLRQQHTIIPIEGANYAWSLVWSDDGQSLTYATGGSFLPVTQSWWLYDLITHTQEVLPPLQNRVTNTVREVLGVCPFPLPDIRPYPCSPNLQESPTSNRIVFSSMLVGHDFNTWLANVDGTGAIHLETIPEAPSDVMWSNNEQWVLIGVYAAIDHSHVYYLVSSDGTFVESLEELTNTNHWRVQGVRPQFSPDGQIVVTASDDNSARIWNVESGNLLADLSGHSSIVFSAQLSYSYQIYCISSTIISDFHQDSIDRTYI